MGILDKKNEDVTITRKMGNGSSVTYKSPEGSQMDMSGLLGQMSEGFAQGGRIENYQAGGMLTGSAPSPVADNKMVNVTPGEFVVNQPAAQKYKGLLEQINNEGKQMLSQGGWTPPQGQGETNYGFGDWISKLTGGTDQNAGYGDYNQQDFVNEANAPNSAAANSGYSETGGQSQQYPPQVILDPGTMGKDEFDRMDQLVRNGIYSIDRDRAGRAIYKLSDLGSSHNVRAVGSGVDNPGYDTSSIQPREDVYRPDEPQPLQYGGRGVMVEAPGARADVAAYGQSSEQAPTVTPGGQAIKYKAGQSYNVANKQQAMEFVSAGIVAQGAQFALPDGTTGVAQ